MLQVVRYRYKEENVSYTSCASLQQSFSLRQTETSCRTRHHDNFACEAKLGKAVCRRHCFFEFNSHRRGNIPQMARKYYPRGTPIQIACPNSSAANTSNTLKQSTVFNLFSATILLHAETCINPDYQIKPTVHRGRAHPQPYLNYLKSKPDYLL